MRSWWACGPPDAVHRPKFEDDVVGVCARCGAEIVWRRFQASSEIQKVCLGCSTEMVKEDEARLKQALEMEF